MGNFNLSQYMGNASTILKDLEDNAEIVRVSVYDCESHDANFYGMKKMEALKDSIYALGGVMQNVILKKQKSGSRYKYLTLAGHRRILASKQLVEEGYPEYDQIPAKVFEADLDEDTELQILILTNCTARGKLDDYEQVQQHMLLKDLIPRIKKREKLSGRTREIEAEFLGVSEGQIGIFDTIGSRLDDTLMEAFRNEQIGISVAYEVAKQGEDTQRKLYALLQQKGELELNDIRLMCMREPIAGQQTVDDIKNVTESVTFQNPKNVTESVTSESAAAEHKEKIKKSERIPVAMKVDDFAEDENVTESDTFKNIKNVTESVTFRKSEDYDAMFLEELICSSENLYQLSLREHNQRATKKYAAYTDALKLLREVVTGAGVWRQDLIHSGRD